MEPTGRHIQRDAYDECAETFGNQSDYLAFFDDDDEFLVLKKHKDVSGLVRDHLPNGSLSIRFIGAFLALRTISFILHYQSRSDFNIE